MVDFHAMWGGRSSSRSDLARRIVPALWLAFLFLSPSCSSFETDEKPSLPGQLSDGRVLLPNGWILSPAGRSVPLGDLPLGIDISPDGRFAVVSNCGLGAQGLSLVDISREQVIQTVPVKKTWLGVRFDKQGKTFLVSAGDNNRLARYSLENGLARLTDAVDLGKPWPKERISPAGMDISRDGETLWVVSKESNSLYRISIREMKVLRSLAFPAPLYTCLFDEKRGLVYVSVWGAAQVAVVDTARLEVAALIPVGDHPTEMAMTPDGGRLFVANANHNTVSVVDLSNLKVMETISTSIAPEDPPGSTPNSVAISGDGLTLYVANADNNYLAVIDIGKPGRSNPEGFIPTGWYPTAVRWVNGMLLVVNGKGAASMANPKGEYIAGLFKGSLSFIPEPDGEALEKYTAQVLGNTPGTRKRRGPARDKDNPIPAAPGEPSPIKHVFYIIKENRTYDQVLGDMAGGNGDPSLCLFGRETTPNHHAIAEEFVLLDNFYVDAEVTADGHNWSMAAYANDYVEKTWPTFYSRRGGSYNYEREGMASPSSGYIWDNCLRHGISFRNYGEFVDWKERAVPAAKGLKNNTCRAFRGWDLSYPDRERFKAWAEEFDAFEKSGSLPRFQIIRLPSDHTKGTAAGALTPRAMIADNDLALGMVVERISRSRFWKESAIFVLEDDAQYGPDHVDAHRSVALVISPWARRRAADHTMYTTAGVLRTMELVLGLPPMTQFDAGATPMYAAFTAKPDFTPYTLRPSRIDLEEKNPTGAYGQNRMERMDFSREDAAPDAEFNEIIWKSVKGVDSPMPPPVRSAFVVSREDEEN